MSKLLLYYIHSYILYTFYSKISKKIQNPQLDNQEETSTIVKPSVIAKIYILSSKNFLKKNSPKRFVIRQSRKCRLPSKEFGRERGKGLDTETSALRSLWHSLSFNVCKRADDRGAREARNPRGGRGVRAAAAAQEEEGKGGSGIQIPAPLN